MAQFISIESRKKYIQAVLKWKAHFDAIPLENLHVSISKNNSKLGEVWNVSKPALLSCGNCSDCAGWCYAIKTSRRWGYDGTPIQARAKNWSIFCRSRKYYFADIRAQLVAAGDTVQAFRWHEEGEILDLEDLEYMDGIAADFPQIVFWTYSKMHDIIAAFRASGRDLNSNFHIAASVWGMEQYNTIRALRPHDGLYITLLPGEVPPAGAFHCPGRGCDGCAARKVGCPAGQDTYCEIH